MAAGRMEGIAVPEPFRCRRTDGKQWRCARRAKDGISFCELHHLQAQHRQARRPVPDSLKLPRRRRSAAARGSIPVLETRRAPKKGKRGGRRGGRGRVGKKGRGRMGNGELAMELIRMVLRQMLQRREEKEKRKREEAAAEERGKDGAGEPMERKLELSSSSFLRWCFRSKNVERPPLVASTQMISSGKGTVGREWSRKRVCQFCQENCIRCLVRCSTCKKVIFCRPCVKKWQVAFSALLIGHSIFSLPSSRLMFQLSLKANTYIVHHYMKSGCYISFLVVLNNRVVHIMHKRGTLR